MLPAAYQLPAAVLLLGGGLLACFVGHRLFRVVLGIYGFVTGALIAATIVAPSTTGAVWAMLAGGAIGAVVLILAYFVGVALVGAALGAVIVHLIAAQLAREPHPVVVILGTVVGAVAAMALQRYVIIIATAFGGAWTALVGAITLDRQPRRAGHRRLGALSAACPWGTSGCGSAGSCSAASAPSSSSRIARAPQDADGGWLRVPRTERFKEISKWQSFRAKST